MEEKARITGTLVWYYCICRREVWLIAHQITADQDDDNMSIGRFIHEHSYARDKKEIGIEHGKMDFVRQKDGKLVVSEIKKSSRFLESATMQLALYLKDLCERGIEASGEIRIPEEKKVIPVVLDDDLMNKLAEIEKEIEEIICKDKPPLPEKKGVCSKCAYNELCFS